MRRSGGRRRLAAEQLLCRGLGIVGMGERRQWMRVERAFVLRDCAACGGEQEGDREAWSGCAHRFDPYRIGLSSEAEKEGISKEFRHEIFASEFAIRQPVHEASVPMYPRMR
jgi:hypothetical protein